MGNSTLVDPNNVKLEKIRGYGLYLRQPEKPDLTDSWSSRSILQYLHNAIGAPRSIFQRKIMVPPELPRSKEDQIIHESKNLLKLLEEYRQSAPQTALNRHKATVLQKEGMKKHFLLLKQHHNHRGKIFK